MKLLYFLLPYFCIGLFFDSPAQVGNQKPNNSLYANAKVYISIDKPVRGQAREDKTIYIDPVNGSYAYIIADNYPNKFASGTARLISYKKVGGQYLKTDEQTYTIDNTYTYTYIKYSFRSAGEYAFDLYDGGGTFINSGFVTVNNKNSNGAVTGSGAFSNCRAFVSIEVPVGGIAKEFKTITIDRQNGSYAYIILDNYPTNLNIDQINLRSYIKVNDKYEKLKEELYDIDPNQSYTYIKYNFFSEGDYAFDIYDNKNNYIKTAYISVSYK